MKLPIIKMAFCLLLVSCGVKREEKNKNFVIHKNAAGSTSNFSQISKVILYHSTHRGIDLNLFVDAIRKKNDTLIIEMKSRIFWKLDILAYKNYFSANLTEIGVGSPKYPCKLINQKIKLNMTSIQSGDHLEGEIELEFLNLNNTNQYVDDTIFVKGLIYESID